MAIEEVKNSGPEAKDYESKVAPHIKSTSDSASSSSLEDRRGTIKAIDCSFDATEDPRYYKPIPTYEGIHRWDPDFEWTEEEEKAVVKKVCQVQGDIAAAC